MQKGLAGVLRVGKEVHYNDILAISTHYVTQIGHMVSLSKAFFGKSIVRSPGK